MSKTAFTLFAFGIYLLVLGLILIFFPNGLLSIFGLPTTSEVWIRVVGVLAFNIGVYYIFAARAEAKGFFIASCYTRTLVFVMFCMFVFFGLSKPVLIFFGFVDLLGGVWTTITLKKENP